MIQKKKKGPPDDPEQSARFIEVGEKILDENAEEKIDEAMRKILLKRPTDKDQNKGS